MCRGGAGQGYARVGPRRTRPIFADAGRARSHGGHMHSGEQIDNKTLREARLRAWRTSASPPAAHGGVPRQQCPPAMPASPARYAHPPSAGTLPAESRRKSGLARGPRRWGLGAGATGVGFCARLRQARSPLSPDRPISDPKPQQLPLPPDMKLVTVLSPIHSGFLYGLPGAAGMALLSLRPRALSAFARPGLCFFPLSVGHSGPQ